MDGQSLTSHYHHWTGYPRSGDSLHHPAAAVARPSVLPLLLPTAAARSPFHARLSFVVVLPRPIHHQPHYYYCYYCLYFHRLLLLHLHYSNYSHLSHCPIGHVPLVYDPKSVAVAAAVHGCDDDVDGGGGYDVETSPSPAASWPIAPRHRPRTKELDVLNSWTRRTAGDYAQPNYRHSVLVLLQQLGGDYYCCCSRATEFVDENPRAKWLRADADGGAAGAVDAAVGGAGVQRRRDGDDGARVTGDAVAVSNFQSIVVVAAVAD